MPNWTVKYALPRPVFCFLFVGTEKAILRWKKATNC